MRNSRARGNKRENLCGTVLERHGYTTFTSRGSRGIDLIAIAERDSGQPHLAVEVGGKSKIITSSFQELRAARKPGGMRCLVARELKKSGRCYWRWHVDADTFFDTFPDALKWMEHND